MDWLASLQQALALMRAGQSGRAQGLLLDILGVEPGNFAAGHLLGVAMLEDGKPQAALQHLDAALALRPADAVVLYNRGNALTELGRLDEAATSFAAAIDSRPAMAEAHFNLGNARRSLGLVELALASFRQAALLQPSLFQAHNNAADVLRDLGRLSEALASVDLALDVNPDHAGALNNRAVILQAMGRYDDAVAAHDQLIKRHGADANVINRRGVALHLAGQVQMALASYDNALALDADYAHAWNNRGNALHDLRRMQEALLSYERAVELMPGYAEAINNRGMVLQDLRQFEASMKDYDQAIELKPGYSEAFKRRAGLNLLQGRFAEGWADFAASADHAGAGSSNGGFPRWQGESLEGKSILLSEPSGLGDTLQFFRFIGLLLQQRARVSFLGPANLHRLLGTFSDQVELLSDFRGLQFDYQCTLWALPHYLRIGHGTFAGSIPYLRAESERVRKWSSLLDRGKINVGICWQGNPARKIDAGRSIPLLEFFPLSQVPGVNLVSLQKHVGLEQLERLPAGMKVLTPGPGFDEGTDAFVDSAALLQSLDLVIAADTSITHLAGALGRPAWVALTRVPDWRWMLDRSDSPWYPSVRLFRQTRLDEWTDVFEAMANALGTEFCVGDGADALSGS